MKKNPIGKYISQKWYRYLIAMVCMLISIGLDMCAPMVTKRIIDNVIVAGQETLLMGYLFMLLGIGVGRSVTQYVKQVMFDLAGVEIACKMRKNLFSHIQKLSMNFFHNNNTGELLARTKDDVDHVWDVLGFVGMLIIEGVIHTVSILICMFQLSPYLTVIPVLILPVIGWIAVSLEKRLDGIYGEISEQNAELNTVAQENLSGVRTVKAFAREEYEIEKFTRHNQRFYDLNMEQAKTQAKYEPNITFLTKTLLILVLLAGGIFVMTGSLTLGALGAFMQYANSILWPMENIGWLSNCLASAIASNRKINKILMEEPEIQDPEKEPKASQLPDGDMQLEFSHVNFTLDGNEILEDITFTLPQGKTLGIMGMTGTGKTTIVNLMQRFYDVTSGVILLNGKDIRELPLQTVRGACETVMQDIFLFSDTIEGNIRLGNRADMESQTVKEAARTAHAASFVERMNQKYDTVIGERGVGLSGGQKQRISLARALAKQAPILIMDDATSALDMETEHAIWQELQTKEHCSKVIIAHRISAVKNADEIIVLKNGRIAERGTHEELMQQQELYYSTWEAQYGDYHKALEVIGEEELICQ
ncbi:MAG: ABC transporter ATP-binding protein [Lachnospiraceae bacterium]|nr:ABC transporter ATP-binding protein [Lachnospiraceae bacterium]